MVTEEVRDSNDIIDIKFTSFFGNFKVSENEFLFELSTYRRKHCVCTVYVYYK